jgi:hypothetical protein
MITCLECGKPLVKMKLTPERSFLDCPSCGAARLTKQARKQKPHCLGPAVGLRYNVDNKDTLINATFAGRDCGCKVIGTGTLQAPFDIEYCPQHAAAPDMYEALKAVAKLADGQGRKNLMMVAGQAKAALALTKGENHDS